MVITIEIFRLFGSIFVDNEKANKSISETDQKAGGLASKLGDGIKTAAKWGAAITGAAVAGGAALFGMATKAAGTTDRIDKLSQKIGISRQGFQEWEFILSQSGTDIEKLQMGMKTLVAQVDQADKGVGKGADNFARLGISVRDTTGKLKDQETLFNEVMVALQNMEDGTEKARLANELLGRSGSELMPLLNGAAGSIDAMKQQAQELGLVISDEAVDAGVAFTDTMDQMKRSLGAVFTQIGAAVIPIFQKMADWILDHMPQIQAVFKTVFGVIEFLVTGFIDGIQLIISWVTQWVNDNQEKVNQIKELFLNFFEAVQGFITAFVEFATAFWQEYGDEISAITEKVFGFITSTIETALKIVTEIFNVFAALFRGDWEALGESVMKIWDSLWEWIKGTGKAVFDIGKNIVQALWDGIKSMWSNLTSWVGNKVSGLLDKLNPFKGGGIKISGPKIPAMATGGTVLSSGIALVGEAGPELLHLPRGAQVAPLGAGGYGTANIVFEVDGRTLAKLIGQPLTEEIRLRTGLKL